MVNTCNFVKTVKFVSGKTQSLITIPSLNDKKFYHSYHKLIHKIITYSQNILGNKFLHLELYECLRQQEDMLLQKMAWDVIMISENVTPLPME